MKTKRRIRDIGSRPLQKISYREKTQNDYEWWKNNIDYYAGTQVTNAKALENYGWYNNLIPQEVFAKVLNPLSSKNEQFKNFPATLRPYNIIRTVVDQLVGEYLKRAFIYQVNVHNPDAHSKMLEEYEATITKLIQDMYVREASKHGFETTEEPRELSPEEERLLETGYDENYKDERAIEGQLALDYLVRSLSVHSSFFKGVYDWLIQGVIFSYKNVIRDDVVYENVNPIEITGYDNTVDYIEDGEFCVRQRFLTASQILEEYYDELTFGQIDDLETSSHNGIFNNGVLDWFNDKFNTVGTHTVTHVTWKSFRKIGILTTINDLGKEVITEVTEDYKLSRIDKANGATLEMIWVNEVLEGTLIMNEHYVRMQPVPCQRNQMNNFASCKLPYNGRFFSNRNAANISLVELAIPYQTLYMFTLYSFELALARNGGKVLVIDQSHIPKEWGSTEKFMYYAKALGFTFINTAQLGASKTFNQYQALDLDTLDTCQGLLLTAENIKREMHALFGITPQRLGEVSQSSQVGTAQMAITQSSVVSEQIFARIDEFVQRELQGLLDCSKMAWLKGFKAKFITSDQRAAILNIDPARYVSTDFGVTVSNSAAERSVLEGMKAMVQPLSQNGASPSMLLNIMQSDNTSKLRNYLEAVEAYNGKVAQQQQEMAMQQAQQAEQQRVLAQKEMLLFESNLRREEMELAHALKKDLFALENEQIDANGNGEPDVLESGRLAMDVSNNEIANSVKNRELMLKQQQMIIDAKLKAAEIQSDERRDILKNKTALANKVTGE